MRADFSSIVIIGNVEIEKVSQFQFSQNEKISELKSSEMHTPYKGEKKSSKHGAVWARKATSTPHIAC